MTPPPSPEEEGASQASHDALAQRQGEAPIPSAEDPLSWAEAVVLLVSLPGLSERAAYGILAEIGIKMQQFPSAAHLASWAGVCPGNHESAGKRLSGKTRKGNPWLREVAQGTFSEERNTQDTQNTWKGGSKRNAAGIPIERGPRSSGPWIGRKARWLQGVRQSEKCRAQTLAPGRRQFGTDLRECIRRNDASIEEHATSLPHHFCQIERPGML